MLKFFFCSNFSRFFVLLCFLLFFRGGVVQTVRLLSRGLLNACERCFKSVPLVKKPVHCLDHLMDEHVQQMSACSQAAATRSSAENRVNRVATMLGATTWLTPSRAE
ncbi:hypothetical protein JOM56_011966 [Amanita muscaria]